MQYVSCMNPTAGSFTINPRLQVKPCSGSGTLLILFQSGLFKREARGKPVAGAAFVLSVGIACFSGVTINHSSKRSRSLFVFPHIQLLRQRKQSQVASQLSTYFWDSVLVHTDFAFIS